MHSLIVFFLTIGVLKGVERQKKTLDTCSIATMQQQQSPVDSLRGKQYPDASELTLDEIFPKYIEACRDINLFKRVQHEQEVMLLGSFVASCD